MRTTIKIAIASAVAALGLAATAGPAMAEHPVIVPGPSCSSGDSQFFCDAENLGTTYWTITWYGGSVSNYTTTGATLTENCPAANIGKQVRAEYSYVDSHGVTQYSPATTFICRSGPWL